MFVRNPNKFPLFFKETHEFASFNNKFLRLPLNKQTLFEIHVWPTFSKTKMSEKMKLIPSEAATRGVTFKKVFLEIHRKTLVPESLFQ